MCKKEKKKNEELTNFEKIINTMKSNNDKINVVIENLKKHGNREKIQNAS